VTDLVHWARELQAIAQSGLTYSDNPYERERFEAVRAVAVRIAAAAGGEAPVELHARFSLEYGYGTPKIDVRGVVVDNGCLLLVREVGETRWTLPGGWADVGQPPAGAVEKEVLEEAGVEARARRVLAVLDRDFRRVGARFPAHAYKLYVQCDPVASSSPHGDGLETEEAAYFPLDALPELSVKSPIEHVQRVLEIALDPARPAELD
jgi:ADP-ribose pyrophosphatase YjhB (NUDIX family)